MSNAKFDHWLNPDGTENYKCRAWVNFNASSGTPTIVVAGNVSSITDNGVGDFTLNFTTALPDADYICAGATGAALAATGPAQLAIHSATSTSVPTLKTVSQFRICFVGAGAGADVYSAAVAIFR